MFPSSIFGCFSECSTICPAVNRTLILYLRWFIPISLFCFFFFSLVVCITPSIPVALWVPLMLLPSWVLDLISRDLPTEEAQQGGPCFYNERADKAKTWHPPRDRFGQIEAETDRAREGEKKTTWTKGRVKKKKVQIHLGCWDWIKHQLIYFSIIRLAAGSDNLQGKHSGNTLFSAAACLCASVGLNAKSMSRLAQITLLVLISLALVPNQSIFNSNPHWW